MTQAIFLKIKEIFKSEQKMLVPDHAQQSFFPIRHLNFQFDGKDFNPKFFQNAELATSWVTALSIFLTYGEDLVIETARYHREFIKDPLLKQRITALIGQEAIHSKLHNEFNDQTLKTHKYPVTFFRFLAEKVFDHVFLQFPQSLKLSMMAGIEHFTAVFAEFAMKHEDIFLEISDEKTRALWMWHIMEESEHKDVAYDVFQELSGNYALRVAGFAIASFTIMFLVSLGGFLIPPLRKPSNLINPVYWKDMVKSIHVLYNRHDGIFGSTLGHVIDYLRPDFHPNDHDTSAYIDAFKAKLLDDKTGLLMPYFIKEFIPPVRAA